MTLRCLLNPWRFNAPQLAQADRLWLTASFRFGPEVARVATILLDRAGEEKQVTGNGGEDSVVPRVPEGTEHFAVLSRTVRCAVAR